MRNFIEKVFNCMVVDKERIWSKKHAQDIEAVRRDHDEKHRQLEARLDALTRRNQDLAKENEELGKRVNESDR